MEHRNWCYFVYDPKHSPFKSLRPLRWLPKAITSRRIFRRWLSKFVKAQLNFRGYFDLYNIPFKHISLFDFTEKKSPLQPGGMNRGPNIFDFLEEREFRYHVSAPEKPKRRTSQALIKDIRAEPIDFAFLYWAGLGWPAASGGQSIAGSARQSCASTNSGSTTLLAAAEKHYAEVRLYVFSDHGMANCDELLDLKAKIEPWTVRMGKDYAVVYDSTMARFWFFNDRARQRHHRGAATSPARPHSAGRGTGADARLFPDRYFGELIFLVNEGVLIVPSHMGERPIRAMHGYHPTDKHSYAALLTNQSELPEEITAIPDIFKLMTRDATVAHDQNSCKGRAA